MAVQLPNGTTFAIGTLGVAKAISAYTNANPGVATLEAAHAFVVGDIGVLTSGWSRANGRVLRASAVATNDVTFEGLDTTATSIYPAGSGVGSIREVTSWTQLSQVLETTTSGGDQQFTTYSFLEDATERQIPTTKSAQSISMTLGDDASLAWYAALSTADADKQPRPLRAILPGGSVIYYNVYCTLNKTPTLTKNQVMGLQATFSLVADPTRYVS